MRETCYCGRIGEIEDRVPVDTEDGERALMCPSEGCGHVDRLEWLPEETRTLLIEEAERKSRQAAA